MKILRYVVMLVLSLLIMTVAYAGAGSSSINSVTSDCSTVNISYFADPIDSSSFTIAVTTPGGASVSVGTGTATTSITLTPAQPDGSTVTVKISGGSASDTATITCNVPATTTGPAPAPPPLPGLFTNSQQGLLVPVDPNGFETGTVEAGLQIWLIDDNAEGFVAFYLSVDEFNNLPTSPESYVTIAEEDGYGLYVLTSGDLQVNFGPTPDGWVDVVVFDRDLNITNTYRWNVLDVLFPEN